MTIAPAMKRNEAAEAMYAERAMDEAMTIVQAIKRMNAAGAMEAKAEAAVKAIEWFEAVKPEGCRKFAKAIELAQQQTRELEFFE